MLIRIMEIWWRNFIQSERGSEVTEQIFWMGLIILAIILLLPQLRGTLINKLSDLINALSQ